VHSVTLLSSREEALAFPTGDVLLGFCGECGFIENLAYEPELQDYSRDYEETQAFSPRFNEFANQLARRLIETYGLRDKDLLEVGGGKGDFLALLCELGPNRGIGVDPAYMPGRLDSEALDRMVFHREFFGAESTHLTGDMVICRHTLEHIGPVREFARLLRDSAARTEGCVVFIEVPDTVRVLSERAFWDIYYEHCSYFTRGSLSRLLGGVGLQPHRLALDFDGQYLVCDASVGSEPRGTVDDRHLVAREIAEFAPSSRAVIDQWRSHLSDLQRDGRRVVLWGAGSKAVAFLNAIGGGQDEVACAVDINPNKHGTFLAGTGHACVAPRYLVDYRPDVVIATNAIYMDEISAELERLDLRPRLVSL
jgi:hypothetical protein